MDKTRILIVDDNTNVTTICRRLLEFAGPYAVCEENSGLKAVATARQFQPEIILLDLEMPEKSGDEVLAELRADPALADISVVLISGLVTRRSTAGRDLLTGLSVLPKPIEPGDLLRKVEDLARVRAARATAAA